MGVMRGAWLVLVGACSFSTNVPGSNELVIDADPGATEIDAADQSPPGDGPAPKPPDFHLRIATIVDGESYIHIKGKTVWFENRIFAAPGRWDADAAAPWDKVPINLNTTAWMPTWPDLPNPENRDCMCLSSTTTLAVGVPTVPSTVTLTEVDVRRAQSVIQAPSAANGWELIVTVSDYMVGGAHPGFVLDIDVKPN